MLFSSMEFVFMFFPAVVAGYFFLPVKARNYWLLIVSLFFYAWGEPHFVLVMVFSILLNYFTALRIDKLSNRGQEKLRKLFLIIAVVGNLWILFLFKYMNFFTANLDRFLPSVASALRIPKTSIVLPIGISFFTFQAMSYVIDVYRGTVPVQKNVFYLGLYISFFPQLIAGPIVRYSTIAEQIEDRTITWDAFSSGIFRFLKGFIKKVLVANTVSVIADAAFAAQELSIGMAWLGALSYTLQIYFDFSGYSDMAIGMGRMFGFTFLENFDYPYASKTLTEFWRRWHISLGSWFRDYVYIPLGGNRVKTKRRLFFNLFVVWLLTGIWHGASWRFILWGLMHGAVVIMERAFSLPDKLPRHKILKNIYRIFALLIVVLARVLFRADGVTAAFAYLKTMFGMGTSVFIDLNVRYYLREYAVYLAAAVLFSFPLVPFIRAKYGAWIGRTRDAARRNTLAFAGRTCAEAAAILLFAVCISNLIMSAHNPFIYFNF